MRSEIDAARGPHTPLEEVLQRRLGLPGFRTGQREIIEAVLSGRDALAVMPTGGGKSLTYQLPAMVTGRCSLVVSPLIALMNDQVDAACRRGVRAESIDSAMSDVERSGVLLRMRAGETELLYVSPEGLPRLVKELRGTSAIGLFAVDEAHCISQWGHDFRPDYRDLGAARAALAPAAPLLAVTATATLRVEADIVASLGMSEPFVHRGSFFRPNLMLSAWRKDGVADGRDLVAALLRSSEGGSAIVYRTSRAGAMSLAGWLRHHGVAADAYHAGLEPERRVEVQRAFLSGECRVVVATVAFGMGVDKRDVRLVVHGDLPGSLEAYAQEVGRAGRDGERSECVLLYSWADVRQRQRMLAEASPERAPILRASLYEMYRYASGGRCRQRTLSAHFGQVVEAPCGSCDTCRATSVGGLLRHGGW